MNCRSQKLIDWLSRWLWPAMKWIFKIDVIGEEHLPKGKALIVANHNSGALVESHSLVFLCNEKRIPARGLNHRALFKIPLVSQYFQWIGAIPATREATLEALSQDVPVLIFPGGNREAFRSLADESNQGQHWGSGWAEMAQDQQVPVVAVKFSGSHRINPIFLSSKLLSRLLILPWLLKVKYFPISLAQILSALSLGALSAWWNLPVPVGFMLTYFGFTLTPLLPVLPGSVKIRIYPPLLPDKHFKSSLELETQIKSLMSEKDIPFGVRTSYPLNGIELFMLYNESKAISYNSQLVFDFTGVLDRKHILNTTEQWIQQIPYLRTAHSKGWLRPRRASYNQQWFKASDIVSFELGLRQSRMDDFCNQKFSLAFEPGVKLLFQSEHDQHRMIFCCHHSLFDGAAQAFAFEAWARVYNGKKIPSGYRQLRPFRYRSATKLFGWLVLFKGLLKNFSLKPPRAVQGVASLSDQKDQGQRRVTSRTLRLPANLDTRSSQGFNPLGVVLSAVDHTLCEGGDFKTPVFVLAPVGLRWTLKIKDSLQNAVLSVNLFLRRELFSTPGWIEGVERRLAANPILSNQKFILGALAAIAVLPEKRLRHQLNQMDRPETSFTSTFLYVRAPIPRNFPLPMDWHQLSISARGTLLRSPSVGLIMTGQKGHETLTIEWIESLVSKKTIDSLEANLWQQMNPENEDASNLTKIIGRLKEEHRRPQRPHTSPRLNS